MNQVWHSSQAFYTREFSFDLAWTSCVLIVVQWCTLKRRMANLTKLRFLEDCKTDVSAHSSGYQPVIVSYRLYYRQSLWNRFTCGFLAGKNMKKPCYIYMTCNPSMWSRWYRFLRQHHLKCLLIPISQPMATMMLPKWAAHEVSKLEQQKKQRAIRSLPTYLEWL